MKKDQMDYNYLLFDLDGTIIDSQKGIIKSLKYSLSKFNIFEDDIEVLKSFIGPSLKESFSKHYDFDEKQCDEAIVYYREIFADYGTVNNDLYLGIKKLLNDLKSKGAMIALATSKPTVYANKILKHLEIEEFFTVIVGSNLDGTRFLKADVIREVFKQLDITNRDLVAMIGDRSHDMVGAATIGIDGIGVTYGFGSFEELKEYNPKAIVNSVDELRKYLLE